MQVRRIPVDAVLAPVILSLGVMIGVLARNDLFGVSLLSLAAMSFLVPLAIIVSVIAVIGWAFKPRARRALRVATIVAWSLVLATVISFRTGALIDWWKVDAMERYVTRAAIILDGIKAKSGSYPQDLPVGVLGQPPELLKNYGSYTSNGQSFRFEYINEPAGWAGGEGLLQFNSTDRVWNDER